MNKKSIIDKVWEQHEIKRLQDGSSIVYIDRQYIHEVTSPQAFQGLKNRKVKLFHPEYTLGVADHVVPGKKQDQTHFEDPQVTAFQKNCRDFGVRCWLPGDENHGIVHVAGPEMGATRPGMTIVCGDSHTSTHGAFGAMAFGIGTSEVEMVMASQCLVQTKPKTLCIEVNGILPKAVGAKDLILYIISKYGTDAGRGYFMEFKGTAIDELSMEGRMTLCNMSIEMGARGGMIAPDEKTYKYLMASTNIDQVNWDVLKNVWNALISEADASYDKYLYVEASDVHPMLSYGTNPGESMAIDDLIPFPEGESSMETQNSLDYMGFNAGEAMLGKKIEYVFLGSCTNGRIEDFRSFASIIKGRKKSPRVKALIVPGSEKVLSLLKEESLDKVFEESGFEIGTPSCSACLAMNGDVIPSGKYCVSTSNRNFKGRQGPGARTILAGPLVAAAAALAGKITHPIDFL